MKLLILLFLSLTLTSSCVTIQVPRIYSDDPKLNTFLEEWNKDIGIVTYSK
jgi:hypothetical protein